VQGDEAVLDHIFGRGGVAGQQRRQANQRPVMPLVQGSDCVLIRAGQHPDRGRRGTGAGRLRTSRWPCRRRIHWWLPPHPRRRQLPAAEAANQASSQARVVPHNVPRRERPGGRPADRRAGPARGTTGTSHEPARVLLQQAQRRRGGELPVRPLREPEAGWPISWQLSSALVRYRDGADAGPVFFNLAREVGLIHGPLSGLERPEFWLRRVRQVQACDRDQA